MPIPKKKLKIIIAVIILGRGQNMVIDQGSAQSAEEPEVIEIREDQMGANKAALCSMINAASLAAFGNNEVSTLTIYPAGPTALTKLAAKNVVEVEWVFEPSGDPNAVGRNEGSYTAGDLADIDNLADLI